MANISESAALYKLFYADWSEDDYFNEFSTDDISQRKTTASLVFKQLYNYLKANKRFWHELSVCGDDDPLSCRIIFDFDNYNVLQLSKFSKTFAEDYYKRDDVFDENDKTYHAKFTVNPETEYIEIAVEYKNIKVYVDDKRMNEIVHEFNNTPHRFDRYIFADDSDNYTHTSSVIPRTSGIFTYNTDNKTVIYWTQIGYAECKSVNKLLDRYLPKTLAMAYSDLFNFASKTNSYRISGLLPGSHLVDSSLLVTLFHGEWSKDNLLSDFTFYTSEMLMKRGQEVFDELNRYLAANNSHWTSYNNTLNELTKRLLMCEVTYRFHLKEKIVDEHTVFTCDFSIRENKERKVGDFKTVFVVRAQEELIQIGTELFGIVYDNSAVQVKSVIQEINNDPFMLGKFEYSTNSKHITHWTQISYLDTDFIPDLIDHNLCKIIATAYVGFNEISQKLLARTITTEDIEQQHKRKVCSKEIERFFAIGWKMEKTRERDCMECPIEQADDIMDDMIDFLRINDKWFKDIVCDTKTYTVFFTYTLDEIKFTAAWQLMAPSESLQLVINTGITYLDEHVEKLQLILSKINSHLYAGRFVLNKANNSVSYMCGFFYKLRGASIFKPEEIFCKAMAIPLVYMNEIKAAVK